MRNRTTFGLWRLLLIALLAGLIAACADGEDDPATDDEGADDPAQEQEDEEEQAEEEQPEEEADPDPELDVHFVFASASALGFADVPVVAAFEALEANNTGVSVEFVEFGDTGVSTQALVQGDVDMAIINVPGLTAANNQGAGLLTFFNAKNNEWSLAARVEITDPSELDGLRVAHHGLGITEALALLVREEYDAEPNYLAVPGSDNRVQALVENQIDGSPVDVGGLVMLEMLAPGEFHALIRYDEVTDLIANHVTAREEVLEAEPEAWRLVTHYLVCANIKSAEDPDWLAERAIEILPNIDPEEARLSAEANAERGVWRTDGSMSADEYGRMMDFYVESDLVAADDVLDYEDFMYSRYVEAAADDIAAEGCPF